MAKSKKVVEGLSEVQPIPKELLEEAKIFTREQALAMVGFYYSIQKVRVGTSNKISAGERGADVVAEPGLIKFLKLDVQATEDRAERGLTNFARNNPLGQWSLQIAGVGPVLAAALLAHIDIYKAKWLGQILSFAGQLDPAHPKMQWKKGCKRPWNAQLKQICWKLGESFRKCSVSGKTDAQWMIDKTLLKKAETKGVPIAQLVKEKRARTEKKKVALEGDDYLYVRMYMDRKVLEQERNDRGMFEQQALGMLKEAKDKKRAISDEQREIWSSGKLQPIGIERRASRYAVKMFLSHWHQIGREIFCGEEVKPWVIVHGGHGDYIPPPLWPMQDREKRRKKATFSTVVGPLEVEYIPHDPNGEDARTVARKLIKQKKRELDELARVANSNGHSEKNGSVRWQDLVDED